MRQEINTVIKQISDGFGTDIPSNFTICLCFNSLQGKEEKGD